MSKGDALPMVETHDGKHLCWSCKEETGEGPFCESCIKIQPVEEMGGFFELFGIEMNYGVDPERIKKTFYELSRQFHPDFYSGKTDAEKELARDNSAYLNKALRILSDPLLRAEYILSAEAGGFTAHPAPPQELFEEILEIGELLVEDDEPGEDDRAALIGAKTNFKNRQDELIESLDDLFVRLLAGKSGIKVDIEARLNNIKYLRTIISRIDKKLNGTV